MTPSPTNDKQEAENTMTAQYMINEKVKSTRAMNEKIIEAEALIARSAAFLKAERKRNEASILKHRPISTWADVGDMGRVLELLNELENALSERARLNA